VTITKEHSGIFGAGTLAAVAQIPVIAGGIGSITAFKLRHPPPLYQQGPQGVLPPARCSRGHFDSRTVAKFAGGVEISGDIDQACKAKG
jgi:hypothetical protein